MKQLPIWKGFNLRVIKKKTFFFYRYACPYSENELRRARVTYETGRSRRSQDLPGVKNTEAQVSLLPGARSFILFLFCFLPHLSQDSYRLFLLTPVKPMSHVSYIAPGSHIMGFSIAYSSFLFPSDLLPQLNFSLRNVIQNSLMHISTIILSDNLAILYFLSKDLELKEKGVCSKKKIYMYTLLNYPSYVAGWKRLVFRYALKTFWRISCTCLRFCGSPVNFSKYFMGSSNRRIINVMKN